MTYVVWMFIQEPYRLKQTAPSDSVMEFFSFIATLLLIFVVYKVLDYLLRLPTVGQYSERYILMTGCGSGFGRAFVHRLDELGCHVFAGCSTETGQLELNDTCSERIQTLVLDSIETRQCSSGF
jgi:hypothetical protein